MNVEKLEYETSLELIPREEYNFNANFHKPSHFPSSDNVWENGKYWITMVWQKEKLGILFEDISRENKNKMRARIYSKNPLSKKYLEKIVPELRWRFNLDNNQSEFYKRYENDKMLGPVIKRWKGMKPVAANSLYETLMIYMVLQNAPVRRSVQMLENLFDKYGEKVEYAGKVLSTFWEPKDLKNKTEEELRNLKLGYRTKFIKKISEQIGEDLINEMELRREGKTKLAKKMSQFYGVGPATLEYLLFEDFYHLDALETIPPWEQKILSRIVFDEKKVPSEKIIQFFKKRYPGFEKLAIHYLWEDLFWKHKKNPISWLEKEIRL